MSTSSHDGFRPLGRWVALCGAGLAVTLTGVARAESHEFMLDLNHGQSSNLAQLDGPPRDRLNAISESPTASTQHEQNIDNTDSVLSFDEDDLEREAFPVDGEPGGTDLAARDREPHPQEPPAPPQPAAPPQPGITPVELLERRAITPNMRSTAQAIGTACPQVVGTGTRFSEDCTDLVVAAASGEIRLEEQSTQTLSVVTVDQATVPLSSSRASLGTQLQNLSSRLTALRGGATGVSVRGFAMAGLGEQPLAGGAASADGSIFSNERVGVFVNGTYSSGDKDGTANEDGFGFDAWGFTAGVDYRFTDAFVLGLALGFGENVTKIDHNGGRLDTKTFSVSAYGTYFLDDGLYLDGILTYSDNDYDQRRNLNYTLDNTLVRQTASADYDGSQWSMAIGGGYQFSNGPWSYGPTLRLEYISASVDGYAEQMSNPNLPGGGWAARLNKLDQESFTSSIGFDLSRAVSMEWGVLSPQLNLSWIHEFKDDALNINGVFVEDPNRNRFSVTSDRPDSDYFNGRIAVAAQMAGGTSAFLYYNKVFGYKNLDVDSFGAGVRMAF